MLLADLLVLLQKQDDKLILKCQSKSNTSIVEGKQMLSPIIKLDSVFLRDVATGTPHATVRIVQVTWIVKSVSLTSCCFFPFLLDQKAFYVIFTWDSGAQIYELVAQSIGERKM